MGALNEETNAATVLEEQNKIDVNGVPVSLGEAVSGDMMFEEAKIVEGKEEEEGKGDVEEGNCAEETKDEKDLEKGEDGVLILPVTKNNLGVKAKAFIIEQVNPKFKSYNKPLFLALIVGLTTLALTLMLFTVMITNCTIVSFAGSNKWMITDEVKKNAKCVHWYADMIQYETTKEIKYASCTWMEETGVELCEAEEYSPACGSTRSDDKFGAYLVSFQSCPNATSTFGSALGYAGFIELFCTIILVVLLKKVGYLKGGDNSYLRMWIKEVVEEKEQGKAIIQEGWN